MRALMISLALAGALAVGCQDRNKENTTRNVGPQGGAPAAPSDQKTPPSDETQSTPGTSGAPNQSGQSGAPSSNP